MSFVCRRCGEERPESELSRSGVKPHPACKPCVNEYQRAMRVRYRDQEAAKDRARRTLAAMHSDQYRYLVRRELRGVAS